MQPCNTLRPLVRNTKRVVKGGRSKGCRPGWSSWQSRGQGFESLQLHRREKWRNLSYGWGFVTSRVRRENASCGRAVGLGPYVGPYQPSGTLSDGSECLEINRLQDVERGAKRVEDRFPGEPSPVCRSTVLDLPVRPSQRDADLLHVLPLSPSQSRVEGARELRPQTWCIGGPR